MPFSATRPSNLGTTGATNHFVAGNRWTKLHANTHYLPIMVESSKCILEELANQYGRLSLSVLMKAKGHGKGEQVTFYVLHTCIHYADHKLDINDIWDACIDAINCVVQFIHLSQNQGCYSFMK